MELFENLNWSWKKLRTSQEHLEYFNKEFTDNPKDILLCHLNEIEPKLIDDIMKSVADETIEEKNDDLRDPRNQDIVKNLIYDYSESQRYLKRTKMFDKFTEYSTLTKQEQLACYIVLKNRNLKLDCRPEDEKIYELTTEKRCKEYTKFNEYLENFLKLNSYSHEFNYINDIYKLYLNEISAAILRSPNKVYSLETALPLPYKIKSKFLVDIQNLNISKLDGYVPKINENIDFFKFPKQSIKYIEDLMEIKMEKYENLFGNDNISAANEYRVILTDEALKIFLGSVDENSEWELPFEISEKMEGIMNFLFESPFPMRCINHKTNLMMFQELFPIHLNYCNEIKWFKIKDNNLVPEEKENCYESEIYAKKLEMKYKLRNFVDFLSQEKSKLKKNKIEIECNLMSDGDSKFDVTVISRIDLCEEKNLFINFSPKLEYCSEFGNSYMTKIELLDEWVKQKFIKNSITKRHRINAHNLELIQIEDVTLEEIESSLKKLYNVDVNVVLASLFEFFQILTRFPCDHYVIKYNPIHRDKMIVYRQKEEIKQNTFDLHNVYGNYMKNSNLMKNFQTVRIDENSISPIHDRFFIHPCCFPPADCKNKPINNNIDRKRRRRKPIAKKQQKQLLKKEHMKKIQRKQPLKNSQLKDIHAKHKRSPNFRGQQNNTKMKSKQRMKFSSQKKKPNQIISNNFNKNKINFNKKNEIKNNNVEIDETPFSMDDYLANFNNALNSKVLTREEINEEKQSKRKLEANKLNIMDIQYNL